MEDSRLNKLDIYSDKGTYELFFNITDDNLAQIINTAPAIVIDEVVLELYRDRYTINEDRVIRISAKEEKKTPDTALYLCEELMIKGVRRNDTIVAIGGGITQDLVTFAASILYRGVPWVWIPTTLLAQADSCIGGKSSLNYKSWKNILGNFYPPHSIYIQETFLSTLSDEDIRSGIGEILKVHLLSGPSAVKSVIDMMEHLDENPTMLSKMIFNSLKYKNEILKVDALDTGLRLKMNYGHSFGHALESATDFAIPHGIAVTIGLDVANYFAMRLGLVSEEYFRTIHDLLNRNLKEKDFAPFTFETFISSLRKDKKNDKESYRFVVPVGFGEVMLKSFPMESNTEKIIKEYFNIYYWRKTL